MRRCPWKRSSARSATWSARTWTGSRALRAGFVMITDRYVYSLIARAIVRGADPEWIKQVYSFALKPDAVFYLRIRAEDLVPRVLADGPFDYWESGMDMPMGEDLHDS